MAAPQWAKDLVVTTLRRADGVRKEDLQAELGIGPNDLREALGELESAGDIEWDGRVGGWRAIEGGGAAIGQDPDAEEETAADPPEGAATEKMEAIGATVEEPGRFIAGAGELTATGPEYGIRVELSMRFSLLPEDVKEDEGLDMAATRHAERMTALAADALLGAVEESVVSAGFSLQCFDGVREVVSRGVSD